MRWLCAFLLAWAIQAAPVAFEPNAGGFLTHTRDYTVAIAASHVLIRAGDAEVDMQFVDCRPAALDGLERLPGVVNYFAGKDATRWRRDIPTFAEVRERGLYPGVDILYHARDGHLEYDFVAAPGADLSRIRMRFVGVRGARIDGQGDLVLDTAAGELRQMRPRIYQGGSPVDGYYRMTGEREVAVLVQHYDAARTLVIDPELLYAAKISGGGMDQAAGIAVDGQGNTYVLSEAIVQQGASASYQVLVTKLDPTGQHVLYSTYIGAGVSAIENAGGIAVDQAGNAYVTGAVSSGNFPITAGTVNAGTTGAFVVKLSPGGDSLVYSTIVAPLGTAPGAIAVDAQGNAYVTGTSMGELQPTPGAYSGFNPVANPYMETGLLLVSMDGFVLKLNPQGSALVYATYTNTSFQGAPVAPITAAAGLMNGIAVDTTGNAYVTGATYVMKFNASGSGLVYSTQTNPWGVYYSGNAIAVDTAGNAYVAGSTDFGHAFVTRLDADGHSYFNTGNNVLTGEQYEQAKAVAVDSAGHVFVGGNTTSQGFPLRAPFQEAFSPMTGFLAELDDSGNLIFSTYVGNNQVFRVTGLALDPSGKPVVCGSTEEGGEPQDSWVAKYDVSGIPTPRLDSLGNLGSELAVPVSPGELVSIRGAGIASDAQLFFDGQAATMIPGSTTATAVVPNTLAGKAYTLAHLEAAGQRSNAVLIPVAPAAPGILTADGTGMGQALALNQDGTANSRANPAKSGSLVTFFATGTGQAVPATVSIADQQISKFQVSWGLAPGLAADVTIIRVRVPNLGFAGPTAARVVLVENDVNSQGGVTISIAQ